MYAAANHFGTRMAAHRWCGRPLPKVMYHLFSGSSSSNSTKRIRDRQA